MKEFGVKNPNADLSEIGLKEITAYWNLTPEELIEHTITKKMGVLADTGALAVATGEFTGRSPKDRFIVKDSITADSVDWNDINMPFDADKFDMLKEEMIEFLIGKELYVRDVRACADRKHQLKIRVMTELPWANMFAGNMFLRSTEEQILRAEPEWQVLAVPSFRAESMELVSTISPS